MSKRNDGAVLAPVKDFTKNSRQSSNLSLIAAISQDQIIKGKKKTRNSSKGTTKYIYLINSKRSNSDKSIITFINSKGKRL